MRRIFGFTGAAIALVGLVGTGATGLAQAHAKRRPAILYLGDTRHHHDDQTFLYRAHPNSPSNRIRLHLPARTFVDGVAVSPDGKHVVELLDRLTDVRRPSQIAIADRDGRHLRVVMRRVGSADFYSIPVWGPDSSTLYFSRSPREMPQRNAAELLSMSARHKNPRVIPVRGGALLQDPALSPDGKRLAAVEITSDDHCCRTTSSLFTLSLATGKRSDPLLTAADAPFPLDQPAWSQDGQRIAIVRYTNLGTQDNVTSVINVVRADGNSAGAPMIAADGGARLYVAGPAWRNARQLWFSRKYESEGSTDIERPDRPADLFSVNLTPDGFSAPQRQTDTRHLSEYSLSFSR